jgi:hypothetical protein
MRANFFSILINVDCSPLLERQVVDMYVLGLFQLLYIENITLRLASLATLLSVAMLPFRALSIRLSIFIFSNFSRYSLDLFLNTFLSYTCNSYISPSIYDGIPLL